MRTSHKMRRHAGRVSRVPVALAAVLLAAPAALLLRLNTRPTPHLVAGVIFGDICRRGDHAEQRTSEPAGGERPSEQ